MSTKIKEQYKGVEITLNDPYVKRTIKLSTATKEDIEELLFRGIISEDMLVKEIKYNAVPTKKKTKEVDSNEENE